MKHFYKMLLALVAVFVFVPNGYALQGGDGGSDDIIIIDKRPPFPRPRTLTTVEASYDAACSLLEVNFLCEVGQVTIALRNSMNQTVVSYNCNSAMEPQVWLPVSLVEGESYTLQIVGANYEGVGYLVVE